jgi:hypothetical protein
VSGVATNNESSLLDQRTVSFGLLLFWKIYFAAVFLFHIHNLPSEISFHNIQPVPNLHLFNISFPESLGNEF